MVAALALVRGLPPPRAELTGSWLGPVAAAMFVGGYLCIWLLVGRGPGATCPWTPHHNPVTKLRLFLSGLLGYAPLILLTDVLLSTFTGVHAAGHLGRAPDLASWTATVTVAVAVAPWVEERVFRGRLWLALSAQLSTGWTLGLTTLAFAACHAAPSMVLYAALAGLWLGWLRHHTGTPRLGVFGHMGLNLAPYVIAPFAFRVEVWTWVTLTEIHAAAFLGGPAALLLWWRRLVVSELRS